MNPEQEPRCGGDDVAKPFRKTGKGEKRKRDANPAEQIKGKVLREPEEDAGRIREAGFLHKPRHRQKPVLPQQRLELVDDDDEGNQVDQRQAALKQPVASASSDRH